MTSCIILEIIQKKQTKYNGYNITLYLLRYRKELCAAYFTKPKRCKNLNFLPFMRFSLLSPRIKNSFFRVLFFQVCAVERHIGF